MSAQTLWMFQGLMVAIRYWGCGSGGVAFSSKAMGPFVVWCWVANRIQAWVSYIRHWFITDIMGLLWLLAFGVSFRPFYTHGSHFRAAIALVFIKRFCWIRLFAVLLLFQGNKTCLFKKRTMFRADSRAL